VSNRAIVERRPASEQLTRPSRPPLDDRNPARRTHAYFPYPAVRPLRLGTWDRAPLLTPELEAPVFACIAEECRRLRCNPEAIEGTADHVHALVRLHATVSAAELAKQVKGASSHLVTHVPSPGSEFKWQGTYGAFSVSQNDVEEGRGYIRRQKEHHAA
jgi:REP element-mobilizing transposase RayT